MERITENVFIENKVRGCNPGFVVTSEGVIAIDTPVDEEYGKVWIAAINKHGKIRYVVNTEHHMDHFLSNPLFGADVISHKAAREVMVTLDSNFIKERTRALYIDSFILPDGYQIKLPTLTYSDRMSLHVGKHTFELIHTPGHTLGQTAVYIPEEKVVFTGDTVVGQTRTAVHDASLSKWLESLKVLEKLDVRFILPGHGTMVCDKAYLKTQASIVSKRLKAEQDAKVRGISLDEETLRKIDPFFGNRDTGMKPTVVLSSTSRSIESGKHG